MTTVICWSCGEWEEQERHPFLLEDYEDEEDVIFVLKCQNCIRDKSRSEPNSGNFNAGVERFYGAVAKSNSRGKNRK